MTTIKMHTKKMFDMMLDAAVKMGRHYYNGMKKLERRAEHGEAFSPLLVNRYWPVFSILHSEVFQDNTRTPLI